MEENTNSLRGEKFPLEVNYRGSKIAEFYVLNAPYMIIMEHIGEDDRLLYTSATPTDGIQELQLPLPVYPKGTRPLHQHNVAELMFVLEGTAVQHIEDRVCLYEPGHCCIMDTRIKHCEELEGRFMAVFLMLSDEFIASLQKMDLMPAADGSLTGRRSPVLSFLARIQQNKSGSEKVYLEFSPLAGTPEKLQDIRDMFLQILHQTGNFSPGAYLLTAGLMVRLFSLLENEQYYHMEQISLQDPATGTLFQEISRLLEQHNGKISRAELERLTNYNADYLNWVVKKHTRKTLTEYGQTFVLAKARDLLVNSQLSVSAIIKELGFTNRSYFYRIFREKYGMTPKAYRALFRPESRG